MKTITRYLTGLLSGTFLATAVALPLVVAMPSHVLAAAPAQCYVSTVLGSLQLDCSRLKSLSHADYTAGNCYTVDGDLKTAAKADCTSSPFYNKWNVTCHDGVSVTDTIDKSANEACAAHGGSLDSIGAIAAAAAQVVTAQSAFDTAVGQLNGDNSAANLASVAAAAQVLVKSVGAAQTVAQQAVCSGQDTQSGIAALGEQAAQVVKDAKAQGTTLDPTTQAAVDAAAKALAGSQASLGDIAKVAQCIVAGIPAAETTDETTPNLGSFVHQVAVDSANAADQFDQDCGKTTPGQETKPNCTLTGTPGENQNFSKEDSTCGGGAVSANSNCVVDDVNKVVNLLSAGVGIVVVIMIIIGGIQYSAAGGDPQKVAGAKKKIFNAVFALLAFIFIWAFLNWIIPGGLF